MKRNPTNPIVMWKIDREESDNYTLWLDNEAYQYSVYVRRTGCINIREWADDTHPESCNDIHYCDIQDLIADLSVIKQLATDYFVGERDALEWPSDY